MQSMNISTNYDELIYRLEYIQYVVEKNRWKKNKKRVFQHAMDIRIHAFCNTVYIEAVALACPCLGCQVKATLRSLMRSRMRRKIWGARATIIATLMQASSVYNRLYRATGDPGVTAQS